MINLFLTIETIGTEVAGLSNFEAAANQVSNLVYNIFVFTGNAIIYFYLAVFFIRLIRKRKFDVNPLIKSMGGILVIWVAKLVNFLKDYDPQSDIGLYGGKPVLVRFLLFMIVLITLTNLKETNHKEKMEEKTEEEE